MDTFRFIVSKPPSKSTWITGDKCPQNSAVLSPSEWTNPVCLGYVGDENLPSHLMHYFIKPWNKDPSSNTQDSWKVSSYDFFVVAQMSFFGFP